MRKMALAVLLAGFFGTAAAGELDSAADMRYVDSGDYSAKLLYRMEFGGERQVAQSLGLRFDNEAAAARGMPSLFQARFGEQGLDKLALNGVDLRGAMLSSNQASGGGFFSSLSVAQWVALGFTAVVFGTVAYDASDSDEPTTVSGTGTGS